MTQSAKNGRVANGRVACLTALLMDPGIVFLE